MNNQNVCINKFYLLQKERGITKLIWNNELVYDDSTMLNDWAILKLKSPLLLTNNVKPACLPSSDWKPENSDSLKERCFTSGWGTLTYGK